MVKWYLHITTTFFVFLNIILFLAVLFKIYTNDCRGKSKPKLNTSPGRIVGGHVVSIEQFRFLAGIIIIKHYRIPVDALQCGASIISSYWVITASHCIELLEDVDVEVKYINVVSNHSEWKRGVKHTVAKMIKNKNYNKHLISNDTGLIRVGEPFKLKGEQPIALAGSESFYIVNSTATVIGWGHNETMRKIVQDTILAANVLILSHERCGNLYGHSFITKDMFCAGTYKGGKDACRFDSGGPIIQNNTLIGIVSWGGVCGNKLQPGVYARVSHFIHWIKEVEKEEKTHIEVKVIK